MIPGVTSKPDVNPPLKLILMGEPKIGKSTWASKAEAPLFLNFEDGANFIDVPRVSLSAWDYSHIKSESERKKSTAEAPSFMSTIWHLLNSEHSYKTIVIDTLGAAYACHGRKISATKLNGAEIDEPDYGAGHRAAFPSWRGEFMMQMDELNAKGIDVVILSHVLSRKFKNAHGADYMIDDIDLPPKAAGALRGWADSVLFARYVVSVVEPKKGERGEAKGTGGSVRRVATTAEAGHVAGNRYGLTGTLPLDFGTFISKVRGSKLWNAIRKLTQVCTPHGRRTLSRLSNGAMTT